MRWTISIVERDYYYTHHASDEERQNIDRKQRQSDIVSISIQLFILFSLIAILLYAL